MRAEPEPDRVWRPPGISRPRRRCGSGVKRLVGHACRHLSRWRVARFNMAASQLPRPERSQSSTAGCGGRLPNDVQYGQQTSARVSGQPALSLLCEALGARKSIVAVPFVNESLWAHPAWETTLAALQDSGV